MKTTIEKLRKEAKIATNMKAKEEFNSTADAIENLATELSNNTYDQQSLLANCSF